MTLNIYVEKITPRKEYIFGLMIGDLLGVEHSITDDLEAFKGYQGPKFSYCNTPLGEGFFIQANGLLDETEVSEKQIEFIEFNGIPAFFQTDSNHSRFTFDLFAASFYVVTRYEEYLPFKHDEYGRFPVMESVASRGGFLRIPVVNIWTDLFGQQLKLDFPELQFKERKYKFIPTIDIDHAYAYKHRNIFRTIGGIGKSILKGKWKQLGQRILVLTGFRKDPYDTYEYIHHTLKERGLRALFFILYAEKSHHDNNVSLTSKSFKKLLKSLSHRGTVGVHPSLGSNKRFSRLESEVAGLMEILGHPIVISRQHFLKISFPKTYQNLINAGIKHDYSMGYAAEPGFKAGIADPFKFYNLILESKTSLTIHPLVLMDVTLRDYYRLDPMSGIELARNLIDAVKSVKGEFVCLWHNESLSESGRWKGWRQVYEEVLNYAVLKK